MPSVETAESRVLLTGVEPWLVPSVPPVVIESSTDPAIPLPDLKGTYQGLDGGLYGGGSNTPPASQAALGNQAAAKVVPLDAQGRPSPHGWVGMLAIGQSTTRLIFEPFQRMQKDLTNRSPALTLVNGAQNGMVLQNWASDSGPWKVALHDVHQAGLSPKQVEVVWLETAEIRAWIYGDLQARISHTVSDLGHVLRKVKDYFPNARIVFLTSRPYGGYAPTAIDPEPYAYESGFSVRTAIQRQIAGASGFNADPANGRVVAPVALWGPYDWANGSTPSSTGLAWYPTDFSDGVHPNLDGSLKAAGTLQNFFTTDPRAKGWFLKA